MKIALDWYSALELRFDCYKKTRLLLHLQIAFILHVFHATGNFRCRKNPAKRDKIETQIVTMEQANEEKSVPVIAVTAAVGAIILLLMLFCQMGRKSKENENGKFKDKHSLFISFLSSSKCVPCHLCV